MATYINKLSTHVAQFVKGKIIPLSLYEGGLMQVYIGL
jgi:hypothetical protein